MTAKSKTTNVVFEGEADKRIFEDSGIGMAVNTLDGQFLRVNQAFCQMLGYSEEELLAKSVFGITYDEDRALTQEARRDIVANGRKMDTIEKRFVRHDGNVIWGLLNRSIINDGQGNPSYFVSQIQDITKRKEAEQRLAISEEELRQAHHLLEQRVEEQTTDLRHSEQRFRDFAEAGADRFWEVDEDFRFTYISPPPEESDRFKSKDIIGKRRWELPGIDPKDDIWVRHRADLEAHRPIRDFLYYRNIGGGKEFWIRVAGKPIFDEAGKFTGYRGTNVDVTAEVRATKEANLSQQRFSDAIESVSAAVSLYDAEDRFVTCNAQSKKDFEPIAEYLTPGTHLSIILEAMHDKILAPTGEESQSQWIKRISAEHIGDEQNTIQHYADGRWMLVNFYKTSDGGTLVHRTDITALREAEEKLALSEKRFRRLYNDTPVMLHSIESDGTIVNVSDYWLEHMGYQRDEVIGKKTVDFMTEDSKTYALEVNHPQFFKGGECRDVPYKFIKKDGEVIDTLLSATAEIDDNGNISNSLAVVVDITERKRAEETLRTQANILTNMAEGVNVADENGIIFFCNPAFERMFGWARGGLIGKHVSVLNAGSRKASQRLAKDLIARLTKGPAWSGEFRSVKKDGTPFTTHARINSLTLGDKLCWITVQEDIT
ncbi:MAG: PAS domain S-box protein, partial [Rhodospirillales bacterium]|nr:PAS domain S-box protein [Rhodospirillales bacterium]